MKNLKLFLVFYHGIMEYTQKPTARETLESLQIWKLNNTWFYDQYVGKEIGWEINKKTIS